MPHRLELLVNVAHTDAATRCVMSCYRAMHDFLSRTIDRLSVLPGSGRGGKICATLLAPSMLLLLFTFWFRRDTRLTLCCAGNNYAITNESTTKTARIFFAQGCEMPAGEGVE